MIGCRVYGCANYVVPAAVDVMPMMLTTTMTMILMSRLLLLMMVGMPRLMPGMIVINHDNVTDYDDKEIFFVVAAILLLHDDKNEKDGCLVAMVLVAQMKRLMLFDAM